MPSTEVDLPADDTVLTEENLSEEDVELKKYLDAEKAWENRFDADWPHERFTYKGDSIACRKPQMQALAAFQLSSSKYVNPEKQSDIVGMFIDRHIGPESYDHIMSRAMDPDDPDYTSRAVIEIMGAIARASMDDIKVEAAKQKKELDAAK